MPTKSFNLVELLYFLFFMTASLALITTHGFRGDVIVLLAFGFLFLATSIDIQDEQR